MKNSLIKSLPEKAHYEYHTLLYYCYVPIENVVEYRDIHHQYCLDNNLLGRIIIAPEGLNGTVSGRITDTEKYMAWVKSDLHWLGRARQSVQRSHDLSFQRALQVLLHH